MQGQAHHVQTGYPAVAAGAAGGGYYPTPPSTTAPPPPPPPPPHHAHHAPQVQYSQQPQQQHPPPRGHQGTSLLSAAANLGATLGAAAIGAASAAATGGGGRAGTGAATAAPAVMQMHAAQMRQHAAPQQQQQGTFQHQFQQVFQGLSPNAPPVPTTCWCGFDDDPECNPCLRGVGKAALFPLAVAAWPLGATLWAVLQTHYCLFSCCMMSHVTRMTAAAGGVGGGGATAPRRDVIDCWECQAKAWVACDKFNGRCWVCELPTTKRVLKGHVVEAPCQLCLWGSTH